MLSQSVRLLECHNVPTYEYACKKCGERFEVFQSFKDRPLKKHADCGGPVNKVFHASGVVFKGPGFYATDSRSSKSSATTKASSSDSAGSSDKKTKDTKSAAGKKKEASKASADSSD